MEDDIEKPECRLIGGVGNIFIIIGAVVRTLKRAGQLEKAAELLRRTSECRSYDEVLTFVQEYVDVAP
jgi:hypothetical protein